MRRWRVLHPGIDPAEPELRLAADEAHHVARVLRLRPGDRIGVFDGAGREWEAVLTEVGRDGVAARLGERIDDPVEPPFEVVLYQGMCRPDRFEWALQKGTEIGIRRFVPVVTERSEPGRSGAARHERWARIVAEACKQSGGRVVPRIDPPTALADLRPDGPAWVLDPRAARPLATALDVPVRGASILAGPEAGLDDAELESLVAQGFERVSLGPRVLRAETAGLVAAAVVLHVRGDLGR